MTYLSRFSGVPQERCGFESPCPVCCRLPFSGEEMATGLEPELPAGGAAAGAAAVLETAGGGGGTTKLAGNQPTPRVRWFWPLHSLISRLQQQEEAKQR